MRDPYGSERIRDASGEVVCVHRHVHSCWPVQPRRSISLWSAAARRGAARRDPHGASVRLHIASATSLQYIHDSHHDAAGLFLAAALLGLALGRLHPAVLQILALRKQVGLGGEERESARAASQQASTRPLSGKHCGLAPWLLPPACVTPRGQGWRAAVRAWGARRGAPGAANARGRAATQGVARAPLRHVSTNGERDAARKNLVLD